MWIVLLTLVGCDVCGSEFSSKCHRTKIENTCVDPGPNEVIQDSSPESYRIWLESLTNELNHVVDGESNSWCLQFYSLQCESGSTVIASRAVGDVLVWGFSETTGKTTGYMTFRDHDMNQKCPVIWVGDEADLECALEGLQRLRDDHEQCGYSRPDVDAGPTCDLERCAGDIYP